MPVSGRRRQISVVIGVLACLVTATVIWRFEEPVVLFFACSFSDQATREMGDYCGHGQATLLPITAMILGSGLLAGWITHRLLGQDAGRPQKEPADRG